MKNFKEFMEDSNIDVENRADIARKKFSIAKERSAQVSDERKKEAQEKAKSSSSAVRFDNKKVVHSKSQLKLPGGKRQKLEEK